MQITVLSEKECRDTLARLGFGRLGCARDNQPYVVPSYFAFEADMLYGFSLGGRKIEWMRSNPRVCVEADEIKSQFEWTSVIAMGRYQELTDTPEFTSERLHAQQLFKERYTWWQTAYELHQHKQPGESGSGVYYRVHIENISGLSTAPEPAEWIAPL